MVWARQRRQCRALKLKRRHAHQQDQLLGPMHSLSVARKQCLSQQQEQSIMATSPQRSEGQTAPGTPVTAASPGSASTPSGGGGGAGGGAGVAASSASVNNSKSPASNEASPTTAAASAPPASSGLLQSLKAVFGYSTFRPKQNEVTCPSYDCVLCCKGEAATLLTFLCACGRPFKRCWKGVMRWC